MRGQSPRSMADGLSLGGRDHALLDLLVEVGLERGFGLRAEGGAFLLRFVQKPFSARFRERAIALSAPTTARFTATGTRGCPKSAAMRRCSDSGKIESG